MKVDRKQREILDRAEVAVKAAAWTEDADPDVDVADDSVDVTMSCA